MIEHPVDSLEVLLAFIVEVLGLGFQLLEPPLGVDIDGIFRMLADIELGFELLRRLWFAGNLLECLLSHISRTGQGGRRDCGAMEPTRTTLFWKPRKLMLFKAWQYQPM